VLPILRAIDPSEVPDGVHLSAKGQAKLANLIQAWSLR
jgi:lysophospholipase L1-like esterase